MNENIHIPDWIEHARKKWEFTGKKRPEFADIPKDGQISVWDFPRPPLIKKVDRTIKVLNNKISVAETKNALMVCETSSPPTYYIPKKDVEIELLTEMDAKSWCEWKGQSQNWALKSKPEQVVAWSYHFHFASYEQLKNHFAFYPHYLQCFVGDELVSAQKNDYYGGWVTKNLSGPIKGKIGSEHW